MIIQRAVIGCTHESFTVGIQIPQDVGNKVCQQSTIRII